MKTLLTLCAILLISAASAAQLATVSSNKAIIYADMALKTPIGYVRKGKRIKVGEVKRMRGTILPFVYQNRIVYIQIKDISLDIQNLDTPKVTQHNIEEFDVRDTDKMSENNHVGLVGGTFAPKGDWEKISLRANDSLGSSYQYTLSFLHVPNTRRYSWGIGFSYYKLVQETISMETLTFDMVGYYDLFQSKYFTLATGLEGYLSGEFRFKTAPPVASSSKGALWGYGANIHTKILPYSTYSLYVGYTIQRLKPSGEVYYVTASGDRHELSTITNNKLYAGVYYLF